MFSIMSQPECISVLVVAYNSSKTILDTLNSVKLQTYPLNFVDLVITDDGSSDSTVSIIQTWLNENEILFHRTKLVTSLHNTGISANVNRGESSVQTVWLKIIAADDILMPNCLTDCINYAKSHSESIYFFGKVKVFGGSKSQNRQYERGFDYSFFEKSLEEQRTEIARSIFLPSMSAFYNIEKVRELGVFCDERMPLLDDTPRFYNLNCKGVRFSLLDKYIVWYRLGQGISSSSRWEAVGYRCMRQFYFYCIFPTLYIENPNAAIEQVVDYENRIYKTLTHSWSYRIGNFFVSPIKRIMSVFMRKNKKYV